MLDLTRLVLIHLDAKAVAFCCEEKGYMPMMVVVEGWTSTSLFRWVASC